MLRPSSLLLGTLVVLGGCARHALPDPRATAAEYAAAAARRDVHAVYALLTADAQRTYGLAGTQRLLGDARVEIAERAGALSSALATARVECRVPYLDGEEVVLQVERGEYKISAAAGLPARAQSPAQALAGLRAALARRSYVALVRVLSDNTRTAFERDLRALVAGLEHPEALDVTVRGDTAEVVVPGGHKVRLVREAGVWRIHDFD